MSICDIISTYVARRQVEHKVRPHCETLRGYVSIKKAKLVNAFLDGSAPLPGRIMMLSTDHQQLNNEKIKMS